MKAKVIGVLALLVVCRGAEAREVEFSSPPEVRRVDKGVRIEFAASASTDCAVSIRGSRTGVPPAGRYVRIELPQRATPLREGRILSVAEVQVFTGSQDAALSGKARQSSGRYPAEVAIDGDGESYTHSDVGEWNPWIEIDLGKPVPIDRLVVWNRPALSERLNGFLVAVLDDDRKVVWYARYVLALPGKMVIEPEAFAGTYVGTEVQVDKKGWYDVKEEEKTACRRFLTDTLFPAGDLDELPTQAIHRDRPGFHLELGSPVDAAARKRRFDNRNSDDAIASLCRRFHRVLKPNVPGLAQFYQAYDAGAYRQALEAYREWFFDKLAHPERYGASTENLLQPLTRAQGKQAVLMRPGTAADAVLASDATDHPRRTSRA
ncbi:MAG TPA: discoidin domain-containing protein [Thermoguttaceae bacterium]|nr:discoidin domain-containing protein [Thermoguttaceae bacterium]